VGDGAIAKQHGLLGPGRHIVFMGHHHHRHAALVEVLKQIEHLGGGA